MLRHWKLFNQSFLTEQLWSWWQKDFGILESLQSRLPRINKYSLLSPICFFGDLFDFFFPMLLLYIYLLTNLGSTSATEILEDILHLENIKPPVDWSAGLVNLFLPKKNSTNWSIEKVML